VPGSAIAASGVGLEGHARRVPRRQPAEAAFLRVEVTDSARPWPPVAPVRGGRGRLSPR